MKKLIVFFLIINVMCISQGCWTGEKIKGDGDLVTEFIEIPDVEELEVTGEKIIIFYERDNENPGIRVTMDRNIRELYKIETEGKRVNISPEKQEKMFHLKPTEFTIRINSGNLRFISAAGNVRMTTNLPVYQNDFSLNVAGNTQLTFNDSVKVNSLDINIAGKNKLVIPLLQAENTTINTAGTSRLELSGNSNNVSFSTAGLVDIDAFDLKCKTMKLKSAGRCKMNVYVEESLHTEVAGFYTIRYIGNPVHLYEEKIGVGSVKSTNK